MPSLTAHRLRELMDYDPNTGVFTWRIARGLGVRGGVAGTINGGGYRVIGVDGAKRQGHRLAWLHMTGNWPVGQVDHKNGIPSDNRWSNLRVATSSQNQRNARPHRDAGLKGTSFNKKRNHWRAHIYVAGRQIYLGAFDTAAEAHAAYRRAAVQRDPDFARFT
jgi:hypothetical protein